MNYSLLTQSFIEYYTNLLIIQYHDKPKAIQTIKLFATLAAANLILLQIRDAFDWKTATGPQLDIIGAWVGVSRFYDGRLFDNRPWFALIDWNKTPTSLQGGFSEFKTFTTLEGGFLDYENISPTKNTMNDWAYRQIIGLKIIYNNINHTAKPIDDAIYSYFEGRVYTTWAPKVLTYHYSAELRELLQVAQNKGVLPCPIGCTIELMEIL